MFLNSEIDTTRQQSLISDFNTPTVNWVLFLEVNSRISGYKSLISFHDVVGSESFVAGSIDASTVVLMQSSANPAADVEAVVR